MTDAQQDLLILVEEGLLPLKTHQEMLEIVDSVLYEHAHRIGNQVEQLGGTADIPSGTELLRASPLGQQLLGLVAYLEQSGSSEDEKRQSRRNLRAVLQALYGRPYLLPGEDMTPFGELVNTVRIKDTRLPEVMNGNEVLQYLNQHAGPQKYYLPDLYSLMQVARLWPIRIRPEGSREKRRYERSQVIALAEQLREEQLQERQEEE